MCSFDRLCADVEAKGRVQKRVYTYRLCSMLCAMPCLYSKTIFRATNKSIRVLAARWEPYAVQTDGGVWKKIVLLDVYR